MLSKNFNLCRKKGYVNKNINMKYFRCYGGVGTHYYESKQEKSTQITVGKNWALFILNPQVLTQWWAHTM